MRELTTSHTSELLKSEIEGVLATYNLTFDNVYSSTADNARNMSHLAELLGSKECSLEADEIFDYGELLSEEDVDGEQDYLSTTVAEDIDNLSLAERLVLDTIKMCPDCHVQGMRCACHTLQLAVADAMDACNVKKDIDSARGLVKKLRTPTVSYLLATRGKNKPAIDNDTRWNSSLKMVDDLLELEEFCKEMEEKDAKFHLAEEEWKTLHSISRSLTPAKVCTMTFQKEQLTVGDFYSAWLKCESETEEASSSPDDLAATLVSKMEEREKSLLENEAIITALFLDLRFKQVLTEPAQEIARNQILNIWSRLEKLKKPVEPNVDAAPGPSSVQAASSNAVMRLLQRRKVGYQAPAVRCSSQFNLLASLKIFESHDTLDLDANVLDFWEKQKNAWPELYEVACTALAVPVTQV